MNILLINHYAGSPIMGMEYRPYYLSKIWTQMGHQVTIIAADFSHIRTHNPTVTLDFEEEIHQGVRYLWVRTSHYQGNGMARVKSMYDFVSKLWKKSRYLAESINPQWVIASSTYPSDNYAARRIARFAKAKYLYEVHDLWPLSPMELGGMSRFHPFIIAMQHAENFAYRNANAVVSMLPLTQEHMKNHGLDLRKWNYIPNGIDTEEWKQNVPLNEAYLHKILEIKKQFSLLVAYTGTLGLANALDYLVKAAVKKPDIGFVIVGQGPEKLQLTALIAQIKAKNVFLWEPVKKQEIPNLLSHFDLLYIGLQSQPLFRFGISPNKLMDYMMAAKPIIQAIEAGNNIVEAIGCGLAIKAENVQAIVDAISDLEQKSQDELNDMGRRGQNFCLENHDYQVLAKQFMDVMEF
jgi:glycosyltransferase involved in cell wall biosynthesis